MAQAAQKRVEREERDAEQEHLGLAGEGEADEPLTVGRSSKKARLDAYAAEGEMHVHGRNALALAMRNKLVHDADITFDEASHSYTMADGRVVPVSLTGLVERHFGAFDAPAVIARRYSHWKWDEFSKYYDLIMETLADGGSMIRS